MVANPFQDGLMVEIDSDTSGLESGLSGAMDSLGDFRTQVGLAGGALATLAGGALAGAVSAASDFENAMVEVEKVTDPQTAEEMGAAIKEMSSEMPVAQEELAGIAEQAGRFGIEGSDNIENFTETVSKMATATDLSTSEAGESFARLSTLTEEPIENVENVGNVINELSNTMATSSSEIVDSALRSSGTLSQMGASTEDIYALNASMNEVSESSQRAGTRLRRMAQEIQDPGKVKGLAEALGMSVEEFKNMRANDPTELIRQMAQTMGEGGEQADALRSTLSTTSQQALTGLSQNLEGLTQAQKTANQQMADGTSLQEEYEAAAATFSSELQVMRNNLQNVAISVGQQLLPALTQLASGLNDTLATLSEWASEGNNATIVAKALGAVLAGGLLTAAVTLGPALASTAAGIAAIAAPALAASAAIGALGAAFQSDFAGIRTQTMRVVSVFRDEFGPIIQQAVATARQTIQSLASRFGISSSQMETSLQGVITTIADGLIVAIRTLGALIRGDVPAWSTIFQTAMTTIRSVITTGFQAVRQVVTAALGQIRTLAETHLGQTVTTVQTRFQQIRTAITTALQGVQTVVQTALTQMRTLWQTHSQTVLTTLRAGYQQVRTVVQTVLQTLATAVQAALTRVQQFWTQHGQRIRQIAQTVIRGAIEAVRTVINHYRTTAQTVLQMIGQLWQTHGGTVRQIGTQIANSLRQLAERFGLVRQNGQPAIQTLVQTGIQLKMLFSPLGRVITLVREMAQAWKTDLMGMRTATMENLPAISTTVSGESRSWSQAINQATQRITQFWQTRLVPLAQQTQQIFQQITEAIVAAMSFVVSEFLAPLLGDLVELWRVHFDDTVQNTIGAMDAIRQAITVALGAVLELWRSHSDEIRTTVELAFDAIRLAITTALDAILTAVNVALLAIQGDWEGVWNQLSDFTSRTLDRIGGFVDTWGSRVVSAIQSMAHDVASEVRSMASDVASEFSSLVSEATVAAGNIASNFLSGIQNMASNAVSEVSSMASNLITEVTGIAGDFRSAGSDMIGALADGIRGAAGKATDAVDNVVSSVRDKLPGSDAKEGPLDDLTDASVAIPETMAAKIESNTRRPARAAEHLAAAVRENLAAESPVPTARASGGGSGGKNVTFQRGAIDVTIQGNASASDVERGLSSALRSYNLD